MKAIHLNAKDGLTIRAFQAVSVERAKAWHGDKPWSPSDWAVAVMGEFGEFCNELKKQNRDRDGLQANNARRVSLGKELADTIAYLVLLADVCGIDLEAETISVFNAISERERLPFIICTEGNHAKLLAQSRAPDHRERTGGDSGAG